MNLQLIQTTVTLLHFTKDNKIVTFFSIVDIQGVSMWTLVLIKQLIYMSGNNKQRTTDSLLNHNLCPY